MLKTNKQTLIIFITLIILFISGLSTVAATDESNIVDNADNITNIVNIQQENTVESNDAIEQYNRMDDAYKNININKSTSNLKKDENDEEENIYIINSSNCRDFEDYFFEDNSKIIISESVDELFLFIEANNVTITGIDYPRLKNSYIGVYDGNINISNLIFDSDDNSMYPMPLEIIGDNSIVSDLQFIDYRNEPTDEYYKQINIVGNNNSVTDSIFEVVYPSLHKDWTYYGDENKGIVITLRGNYNNVTNCYVKVEESGYVEYPFGMLRGISIYGNYNNVSYNMIEMEGTLYCYAISCRDSYNYISFNEIYVVSKRYANGITLEGNNSYNIMDGNVINLETSLNQLDNWNIIDAAYGIIITENEYHGYTYNVENSVTVGNVIRNNLITGYSSHMYGVEQFGGTATVVENNTIIVEGYTPMGIGIIGANSQISNNHIIVSGVTNLTGDSADYIKPETTGISIKDGVNNIIESNYIETTNGTAIKLRNENSTKIINNDLNAINNLMLIVGDKYTVGSVISNNFMNGHSEYADVTSSYVDIPNGYNPGDISVATNDTSTINETGNQDSTGEELPINSTTDENTNTTTNTTTDPASGENQEPINQNTTSENNTDNNSTNTDVQDNPVSNQTQINTTVEPEIPKDEEIINQTEVPEENKTQEDLIQNITENITNPTENTTTDNNDTSIIDKIIDEIVDVINQTDTEDKNQTQEDINNTTIEPEQNQTTQPEENKTQEPEQNQTTQPEENKTQEPEQNQTTQPEENKTQEPEQNQTTQPIQQVEVNNTIDEKPTENQTEENITIPIDKQPIIEENKTEEIEQPVVNETNIPQPPLVENKTEENDTQIIENQTEIINQTAIEDNQTHEPEENSTIVEPTIKNETQEATLVNDTTEVNKTSVDNTETDKNETSQSPIENKTEEPQITSDTEQDNNNTVISDSVENNNTVVSESDNNNTIVVETDKVLENNTEKIEVNETQINMTNVTEVPNATVNTTIPKAEIKENKTQQNTTVVNNSVINTDKLVKTNSSTQQRTNESTGAGDLIPEIGDPSIVPATEAVLEDVRESEDPIESEENNEDNNQDNNNQDDENEDTSKTTPSTVAVTATMDSNSVKVLEVTPKILTTELDLDNIKYVIVFTLLLMSSLILGFKRFNSNL